MITTPIASRYRAGARRIRVLSAAALWTPVAAAQGWAGTVGANSDQVVRGLSETAHSPALAGQAQYQFADGWFGAAGGYLSRTHGSAGEGSEVTVEAGYVFPRFGAFGSQLSVARHIALHHGSEGSGGYNEATVTAFAHDAVFASVSALSRPTHESSQYDARASTVWAFDLLANLPLNRTLSINTGVGYQDLRRAGGAGYAYGNAGVTGQWANLQLQLSYIATDAKAKRLFGDAASNRWVASIVWNF